MSYQDEIQDVIARISTERDDAQAELAVLREECDAQPKWDSMLARIAELEGDKASLTHLRADLWRERARRDNAEAERDAAVSRLERVEEAQRKIVRECRDFGISIASWCPHGFDSSRSWDYQFAADFTRHLEVIRALALPLNTEEHA